jgi:hypothetical protein
MFAKRPDVERAWRQLIGWVNANPSNKAVLDVMSLRQGPWPVFPSTGDLRTSVGAKPELWQRPLAIPTLFAAMRGKDPTIAREAVYRWMNEIATTDPALARYSDHAHWLLGGIIDLADKATR